MAKQTHDSSKVRPDFARFHTDFVKFSGTHWAFAGSSSEVRRKLFEFVTGFFGESSANRWASVGARRKLLGKAQTSELVESSSWGAWLKNFEGAK